MGRTIFKDANLLDGDNPARPGTTVVVEGNRIECIGNGAGSDVHGDDRDDRVVDLRGKTLMPGMYVCHFHAEYKFIDLTRLNEIYIGAERPPGVLMAVAVTSAFNALMSGVTGVVSGACSADIDAQLKMAIEEGIVEGPRVMAASRHINTTGHDNDRAKWWYDMRNFGADVFADGPEELRKAVRNEIKRGAEIVKVFPTGGHGVVQPKNVRGLTRKELKAVIEAAHERGKMVRAHCVWRDSILECIDAGVDVIDHGDEIDGKCIKAMVDAGTFYVPSMLFLKVLLGADESMATAEQMAPIRKDWDNLCRRLPEANDAGVKIVPGDDYGLEIIPHIPGIYARELSIYANDVGVKPVDVLRWATRHGAEMMGMGSELGTVEEGKLADLVVVDGDPSGDISILEDATRVNAVMKDGAFVKDELT